MLVDQTHARPWWTALPAVPPNRTSLDWWASQDGRTPPYQRLKRCWADYTMSRGARGDPDRPHDFYTHRRGLNLCIAVWENFVLWHPAIWVSELFRLAGLGSPAVSDAAWSYEFRALTGLASPKVKQVDIVLHARGDAGDHVVAVEAKAPGDRLKIAQPLPDTDSATYRDLPAFKALDAERHALYLVPDGYIETVRKKVSGEYGFISWQALLGLQVALAGATHGSEVEGPLRAIGRTLRVEPVLSEGVDGDGPETPAKVIQEWKRCADSYLGSFEPGMVANEPPLSYLADEPTFKAIHEMPTKERSAACPDHMGEHWRLP